MHERKMVFYIVSLCGLISGEIYSRTENDIKIK